jgi:quinol monooxygenase YgiN
MAVAALEQYRRDSRAQDGFVRADVFEQVGRPGHFVVIESWRDQKAFDTRAAAPQQRLGDVLRPIRISGYDQRLYKTLSVDSPAGSEPGSAPPSRERAGQPAVVVIAHVDVTPGPQAPVLLRRLADASRREDGNLRFDVLQHTMRANHFTVVETWRSQQAFDAHVAAGHTRLYRDELQPLTGSPLDERVYVAVP